MKKDLNFEELARRRYPKATKEETERIVAKWKAKAKKMAAEPTISLIEFGWVPSDDKNWMPVKLRAMKDATIDVKDSNPLTSDEPMFSSSRWVYDLTNIEISMMPRRDLTEKEQAYMEEMRQRYIAASMTTLR